MELLALTRVMDLRGLPTTAGAGRAVLATLLGEDTDVLVRGKTVAAEAHEAALGVATGVGAGIWRPLWAHVDGHEGALLVIQQDPGCAVGVSEHAGSRAPPDA